MVGFNSEKPNLCEKYDLLAKNLANVWVASDDKCFSSFFVHLFLNSKGSFQKYLPKKCTKKVLQKMQTVYHSRLIKRAATIEYVDGSYL